MTIWTIEIQKQNGNSAKLGEISGRKCRFGGKFIILIKGIYLGFYRTYVDFKR